MTLDPGEILNHSELILNCVTLQEVEEVPVCSLKQLVHILVLIDQSKTVELVHGPRFGNFKLLVGEGTLRTELVALFTENNVLARYTNSMSVTTAWVRVIRLVELLFFESNVQVLLVLRSFLLVNSTKQGVNFKNSLTWVFAASDFIREGALL